VRWPLLLIVVGSAGCRACGSHEAPADAPALVACTGEPIAAAGEATYYDADGTGRCSFERAPRELVAALNGIDYAHGAWCGACLAVSGPGGEVVVRVVDRCPACKHGDLDLSRDAFARIAPLSAGRVRIAWREVPCPVAGPIAYQLKSGSNASWAAIQVRNHRHAIARLEARHGASYETLVRGDDNYFVAPAGLGAGPLALRVTDVRGQVLEDGAGQFPMCP
jgi:expansin (peptidoglycan-binding protein)